MSAKNQSTQTTPEAPKRKKRKYAGVYGVRMCIGLIAITFVIVITGVQATGWKDIWEALFGGITLSEVIRYAVIVCVSICVGYWMKRPRKVYVNKKQQQTEEKEPEASDSEEAKE